MKELLLPSIVTDFIEKSTGECLKGQQWEAAYNSNEFSTAFTQAENEISKNPHNLDAKLWWTICGIKTGSLPLNAISSPLSELIHEANCNQRLLFSASFLMIDKLKDKTQFRLGINIGENLLRKEFSDEIIPLDIQQAANKYFCELIETEIEKNEGKVNQKEYLTKLKIKLEEFSSKTFKAKKPEKKEIFTAPAVDINMPESSIEKAPEFPLENHSFTTQSKQQKSNIFLYAAFVLMFALFIFDKWSNHPHSTSASENTFLTLVSLEAPLNIDPLLPEYRLSATERLNNKFASLNNSMSKMSERIGALGNKDDAAKKNDPEVDSQALESKESQKLKNKTDAELVSIATPTPIITQSPVQAVDLHKTPNLNSEITKNIPVENLDRQPETTSPDVKVAKNGRVFGPKRTVDPTLNPDGTPSEAIDLNGKPLHSYEVKQHTNPLLFKTIAPTKVLSAPSVLASRISNLDADITVNVVAEMGQWLELESRNGRRGYIYAQDAIKVDSRSNAVVPRY